MADGAESLDCSRRGFLKAGAAMAAGTGLGRRSMAAVLTGRRTIRAAIVGCGGRGTSLQPPKNLQDVYRFGALGNLVAAADILRQSGVDVEVKPVAFADYFLDRAKVAARKFGVDESNAYGGANSYKAIMAREDVDAVLLVTPLSFRPRHTMAAVAAGKHIFAEKGVAVDAPGVRAMIAASRLAAEKRLTLVCGTQRRHQRGYLLQRKALDEGRIGPITSGEVYWNTGSSWVRPREPWMSNKDYLCNNWYNFSELSGDHVCEQHVHSLDIANWFVGRPPRSALAFGARMRRVSGNDYDFFSCDFDYGGGVHVHSMCRQINGCKKDVREFFRTREALISGGGLVKTWDGRTILLDGDFPDVNPYVQEHVDFLKSILGIGPYLNEGEACAMASATAVMARLSAYTGQIVTMADLLRSENSPYYNLAMSPSPEDFEKDGDVPMPEYSDNRYPLPGEAWKPAT
ncbi:MAG: Gfo/Idh/MocA family oxidoreductase [Kiritimatiellae bacterium]|nr:Gfo/Idh/MocA family oxidoreductase [Kiritimatiellia bacterium]